MGMIGGGDYAGRGSAVVEHGDIMCWMQSFGRTPSRTTIPQVVREHVIGVQLPIYTFMLVG